MAARFSAATERALALVVEGRTIYEAAKVEDIAYNTLWKAIKRISGEREAGESTFQKLRKEHKELQEYTAEIAKTLRELHDYARQGSAYTRNPLCAKVDRLLASAPAIKEPGKRGVPKGTQTPKSTVSDETKNKIKQMLQHSAGKAASANL